MASEQEIIEEELVYGALRRERLWQRLGLTGLVFGIIGCLSAAAVAILDVDPPPVVVPYDPATGFALPEASVGATSVTANQAIIEAEVFRYVTDREVYNQLDNDLRIRSVLRRSDGAAESGLRQIWNSAMRPIRQPPMAPMLGSTWKSSASTGLVPTAPRCACASA